MAGLRALGDDVDRFADQCGWARSDLTAVQVCLDEILSNALKYGGFGPDAPAQIDVELVSEDNLICVVVEDNASPFNPLQDVQSEQKRTAAGIAIGGRGLMLVEKLMKSMNYERIEERNRLTMTRQRSLDSSLLGGKKPNE